MVMIDDEAGGVVQLDGNRDSELVDVGGWVGCLVWVWCGWLVWLVAFCSAETEWDEWDGVGWDGMGWAVWVGGWVG